MAETFLASPIFVEAILPLVLVFAVVFAFLQKSEVLGKGKRQVDAIVAFVIGLITIAFGQATQLIVYLVPVLAVSVVVILVFMLMIGSTFPAGKFELNKKIQWALIALSAIVVVVALLVLSGWWTIIVDYLYLSGGESTLVNTIIVVIIIAVAIGVVYGGAKEGKDKDKDKKDS